MPVLDLALPEGAFLGRIWQADLASRPSSHRRVVCLCRSSLQLCLCWIWPCLRSVLKQGKGKQNHLSPTCDVFVQELLAAVPVLDLALPEEDVAVTLHRACRESGFFYGALSVRGDCLRRYCFSACTHQC